tara:strand:+ start:388140 stop:389075 length:936 start_codon:yes stop_codon:yes gene_type:complete
LENNTTFNERIQELAGLIHEGFNYISYEEARRELLLWISETTGLNAIKLRVDPPELSEEQWSSLESFAVRRSMGMPFAYLLGRCHFYDLELAIGPGVLIPRPETEELVDRAVAWTEERIAESTEKLRILDLCTGSGCIGVATGHALKQKMNQRKLPKVELDIALSDESAYALEYARVNSDAYAEPGLHFSIFEGDLMAPFRKEKAPPFDLILCNPPYVHPDEIPLLAPETYLHEPAEALFHNDPPALYIQIIRECLPFLSDHGVIIMELSQFVYQVVSMLCENEFPDCTYRVEKDLSGKQRFLIFACNSHP